MRKKYLRLSQLGFYLLLSVFHLMVGCVSQQPKRASLLLDGKEEEWEVLRQKVSDQEAELKRFQSRMELLEKRLSAKKAKKQQLKEFKPKGKKVLRPKIKTRSNRPSPRLMESETVADSYHQPLQLYYLGYRLMKQKQFERASKVLRRFTKTYPNHVYADRAHYLVLESNYKNKEYAMVLMDAKRFVRQFPHSFRGPEAWYLKARSYQKLGQYRHAISTYQRLVENFPTNPMALRASRKIAELNRAGSGLDQQPPG